MIKLNPKEKPFKISREAFKYPYGHNEFISSNQARLNCFEIIISIYLVNNIIYLDFKKIDHEFFFPAQIEQCYKTKSNFYNPSKFLYSFQNMIVKLKGGDLTKLNIEEIEKFEKLTDYLQNLQEQISINKLFNLIINNVNNFIDPVVSNRDFWQLIKILREKNKITVIDSSSSVSTRQRPFSFVEGHQLGLPPSRKGFQLKPAEHLTSRQQALWQISQSSANFNNEPSFFNENKSNFQFNFQNITNLELVQELTADRRAAPHIFSNALNTGEFSDKVFVYSGKQADKKSKPHGKDFLGPIQIENDFERVMAYIDAMENILLKKKFICNPEATLNIQEPIFGFYDPESSAFIAFTNSALYDKNYFISGYKINQIAQQEFIKTGNVGRHPSVVKKELEENRNSRKLEEIRKESKKVREAAKQEFLKKMPAEARANHEQLRKYNELLITLKINPNYALTDRDLMLIKRIELYKFHMGNFTRTNPE
jgi:hypothetical protein